MINLLKTGDTWNFENEYLLEDFIWNNLNDLFNFKALNRQHSVNGQYCDILAMGENKELVILELKNTEDRYIIQQLTRYYDAIIQQKPFEDKIDYEQPIRLIALTPSFHIDNFSDVKYNTLPIDLIKFAITQNNSQFFFSLYQVKYKTQDKLIKTIEIPFQETETTDFSIPTPSKALLNRIAKLKLNESMRSVILYIRDKTLRFDKRIQEYQNKTGVFTYGKGKTKICVEINMGNTTEGRMLRSVENELIPSPMLFLYLPYSFIETHTEKQDIVRVLVMTNWETFLFLAGHTPKGLVPKYEYNIAQFSQKYSLQQLDEWLDLALKTWLERL